MKTIVVLAVTTQERLERDGADVVDEHCQTITEAKKRARYYLTEAYMNSAESTTMLGYAQVKVNGVVEYDYFGKQAK